MRGTLTRLGLTTGVLTGLSLLLSTGVAFADTTASATLEQSWGTADVQAWTENGRIYVTADLKDTASDGKCVYVQYKADLRTSYPGFGPTDPDATVVTVCGEGRTGTQTLWHSVGVFDYVNAVEFKLCKKGWLQDPCVKTVVHP